MWDLIYTVMIFVLRTLIFLVTIFGFFGFLHFIYLGIKDITQSDTKKRI